MNKGKIILGSSDGKTVSFLWKPHYRELWEPRHNILLMLDISFLNSIRRHWRGSQLLSHVWLCDLMDCSPSGSYVHGIFQARILEWVAFTSCRGHPIQRLNLHPFCLLHCRRIHYPLSHWGSHEEVSKSLEIRQATFLISGGDIIMLSPKEWSRVVKLVIVALEVHIQ